MGSKKQHNTFIEKEDCFIMLVKCNSSILNVEIDKEDYYDVYSIGKWHAIYDKTLKTPSYYICHRYNSKKDGKGCVKLHRLVTKCPRDKVIDHKDHNTLNNKKSNLRICTQFENQQNLRSNKSGIVGVYQRSRGNWVGSITKNNKRYSKEFKTKKEAIMYREQMYNKLYKGGD